MKEKILAALKTKHADTIKAKGLGDKALLGIAAVLAITIKDDNEIETAISSDGVVEALTGIQGEVDGRVTDAVKKAKSEKKPTGGSGTEPEKTPNETGNGDDDDVKALLKTLVEQNKTLTEKINGIEKEKLGQTLAQRITTTLKDKKVDEDYITEQLDGREFDSEEAANAFITKVEAGWGKLQQKFANQKLAEGSETPFITNQEGESEFKSMLSAAVKSVTPAEASK